MKAVQELIYIICYTLFGEFIIIKIVGLVDWSWGFVLLPLFVWVGITLLIFVPLDAYMKYKKNQEMREAPAMVTTTFKLNDDRIISHAQKYITDHHGTEEAFIIRELLWLIQEKGKISYVLHFVSEQSDDHR